MCPWTSPSTNAPLSFLFLLREWFDIETTCSIQPSIVNSKQQKTSSPPILPSMSHPCHCRHGGYIQSHVFMQSTVQHSKRDSNHSLGAWPGSVSDIATVQHIWTTQPPLTSVWDLAHFVHGALRWETHLQMLSDVDLNRWHIAFYYLYYLYVYL